MLFGYAFVRNFGVRNFRTSSVNLSMSVISVGSISVTSSTGDQEVASSSPAGSTTFFSGS